MPLDPRRIKALFNSALDLPDPAGRPALLDRECRDDRELRRRLEELLAAHDRPAGVLERPLAGAPGGAPGPGGGPGRSASRAEPSAATGDETEAVPDSAAGPRPECPPPAPLIGAVIAGRYRIRQQIGEGGMGSVYLAEQLQPVKRQVALKLIKAGMDSRTVLARFESERQALALMDHPNISTVLDAGTTDDGRPFFVMELVRGTPLTGYCDRHRLGLLERLALLRQLCSAVQHAHQKGIIHRDLKPSNILVEGRDGRPVPKVIDFGLAKATNGLPLTDQSLTSAFGAVAGTPLYMAPEQASFNAIDVDARDVYALGVILDELLTGSTPIRRDTFRRASLDEILRLIREVEPPTPSSRIGSPDTQPQIAAARQTEPSRLGRFVRGDLDWIVMKALAKDRRRRYESPLALSQDIERFLNHEPVGAGPPTAAYRFRKFVRRHRPQVIAASLVLLALVVGIVGTTLGLIEARRQERIAVAEAIEKEKARRAEAAQRRRAEKRLAQIEKANAILGSIFQDLNPRNAANDGKPLSALLGERLDQATAQLEGEAIGDPLAVARMQQTLGDSQVGLGYPERAVGLFAKARATFTAQLGPDHPDTLTSTIALATGYREAGELDRALSLHEEARGRAKAVLGPDHFVTLNAMLSLAIDYKSAGELDRALPLYEEVLELWRARLGPDHPRTLNTMNSLAAGYWAAGRHDRALPLYEEALALRKEKLGPDHPDTLTSMHNLAGGYRAAGALDRALPLFEEALALRKEKLGPDHPSTIVSMHGLAAGYWAAGRRDRALPLYEEARVRSRARLGPDHPRALTDMSTLASGHETAGELDGAPPPYEEALALRRARFGPDHPVTLVTMNDLAVGYRAAGKLGRALPLSEQAYARLKSKLGPDHPKTLTSMITLASGYQAVGELDRARSLLEEARVRSRARLGPDHPVTLVGMNSLAHAYRAAGEFDRALPLSEQALALAKAKLGPGHPRTLESMSNLAIDYVAAGRLDRALPLSEQALALAKARLGPDHPITLIVLNSLAIGYGAAGEFDRAVSLYEEVFALAKAVLGPDHPETLVSLRNLALGCEAAGKFERSIPLFQELLELRRAHIGADRPETWEALGRLGVNCKGAGRLSEALPLLEEATRACREHPALWWAAAHLSDGYLRAGQIDRAIALAREQLEEARTALPADSPLLAVLMVQKGVTLLRAKAWTEAEPPLREALAIREAKELDAFTTFSTKSMLGGALLGQRRYNDAAPLLRAGYEGLRRRAGRIPPQHRPRLAEALDRLIELAEATHKPEDTKTWRDERAKLPGAPAATPTPEATLK